MTRGGREVLAADQSPQLPRGGRRRRPYGPVVTCHHDASVGVDERHRHVTVLVTLLGGGPVGGPAESAVVGDAVGPLAASTLLKLETLGVEPLGEAGLSLVRCGPVEARDGNG